MTRRAFLPRSLQALLPLLSCILSISPRTAHAQVPEPEALGEARFEQRLGARVPGSLVFRDQDGQEVRLAELLGERPVVLALVQYRCPMLCTLVLDGLVTGLRGVAFDPGDQFDVVVVSIDHRETPKLAGRKKQALVDQHGRPGTERGWHVLVGDRQNIEGLAEAVGFGFAYDPPTDQFAHPSGLVLLTPPGRVCRYLFGIQYPARELRLGLVEASENRIGTVVDHVLLRCFQYDPVRGKYSLAVMKIVRTGGVLVLLGLGVLIAYLSWRSPADASGRENPAPGP